MRLGTNQKAVIRHMKGHKDGYFIGTWGTYSETNRIMASLMKRGLVFQEHIDRKTRAPGPTFRWKLTEAGREIDV